MHPQLVMRVQELEVEVSCAKADPVDIKVGKINDGWVWNDWNDRFVTELGSTTCVDGICCKYIIHEINPQLWVAARDAKTDEERLIYSVPLNGPKYDTDKCDMCHKIQNYCIWTTT